MSESRHKMKTLLPRRTRATFAAGALALACLATLAPASPERLAEIARQQEATRQELREAQDRAAVVSGRVENLKASAGADSSEYKKAAENLQSLRDRARRATQTLNDLAAEAQQLRDEQQAVRQDQKSTSDDAIEARLRAVTQTTRELAAGENPEASLSDAVANASLERLRVKYRSAAVRANNVRQLFESGRADQAQVIEAESNAEAALAELREAELQRMLDRVKRERNTGVAVGAGAAVEVPDAAPTTEPAAGGDGVIQADRQVLQAEFFRGYLETVRRYGELAEDPAASRVAAVINIADMLAANAPDRATTVLRGMLTDLRKRPGERSDADAAVERILILQIADFERQSGRDQEAMNLLRALAIGPGAPGADAGSSAAANSR